MMRLLCALLFIVLTLSLTDPSHAARGFGATDGAGASDLLTSTYTTNTTLTSWSIWTYRTGAGGGNFGRIFDKGTTGAGTVSLYHDSAGATYTFSYVWSSTGGTWTIVAPSATAWHHILVTYDGTNGLSVPVIYVDGTSVTVTETIAASGTITTGATAYIVGNRTAADRNWNGRLAEFAIWESTVLTAGNATSLAGGTLPTALGNDPEQYWKICGDASPEPNEVGGQADLTVTTGTAQQAHPFSNCAAASSTRTLMLLGVGR